jgi:hypothetical protein
MEFVWFFFKVSINFNFSIWSLHKRYMLSSLIYIYSKLYEMSDCIKAVIYIYIYISMLVAC